MSLTYASVCSGVEAASLAWEPLGLRPLWFSEIEPFPCAVLAERWPDVPNLGDMTALDDPPRPDILVGGTPCQSFSVAGLRKGLADGRGNLTLKFVELANALQPSAIVWENVPGVLSSKDNAFGYFLGALAGSDDPLVAAAVRPHAGKSGPGWRWNKKLGRHVVAWSNAGYAIGPERAVAWRVLDAQYFGVAQRRRRVFVVACPRDGADPRKILFEFEGLRRDSPPSRETQEIASALTARGIGTCGADDTQAQAGHLLATWPAQVSSSLNARFGEKLGLDNQHIDGAQDPDNLGHPVGRNGGRESCVCFSSKDHGADAGPISPTLRAGGHSGSHANAGVPPAVTTGARVRRLTPTECERLQGMPDGHTLVTYRGKPASDGPRYKAVGNSMAVPCMEWIGARLVLGTGGLL